MGFPATFKGNPNLYISAINTSAGITMSRTSAYTPAFVQVSIGSVSSLLVGGSYNGITCTGVYKDSDGNTMSGTVEPYQDLEVAWDFGDPSGVETFSKPINNAGTKYVWTAVNANTDQIGPEAAYCYRTAGTKTITCYIRGKASGGGYVTATITANFVVSDFETTFSDKIYCDSSYDLRNGASDGTITRPWVTGPQIHSASVVGGAGITGKSFYMAVGSTFTFSELQGPAFLGSNTRMKPWNNSAAPWWNGSLATPALTTTESTACVQFSNLGPATSDDCVISNIAFSSAKTSPVGTYDIFSGSNTLSNFYLDNCTADITASNNGANVIGFGALPSTLRLNNMMGVWGGSFTRPLVTATSRNAESASSAVNWHFFVGGYCEGSSNTDVGHSHHIYPSNQCHMINRWWEYGPANNTRNMCFNTDWNSSQQAISVELSSSVTGSVLTIVGDPPISPFTVSMTIRAGHGLGEAPDDLIPYSENVQIVSLVTGTTGGAGQYNLNKTPSAAPFSAATINGILGTQYVDFTLFDGCFFSYTFYSHDCSDAFNDPQAVIFRNIVCQNCVHTGLMSGYDYSESLSSYTFRDNLCFSNSTAGATQGVQPGAKDPLPTVLQFKIYRNNVYDGVSTWNFQTYSGCSSSIPLQITDNTVYHTGATADITTLFSGNNTGTNSLVDRNQYYFPNSSTMANDLSTSRKTFAQWKALSTGVAGTNPYDKNSTVANPNWTDPANGDFTTPGTGSVFPILKGALSFRLHQ